ncbi:hypothetical protein AX774_g7209 [Zancudomyces culisetae]|uniref:Uncharacterized protein n=1 Tax=Zancudomyces culisetae TaxID=1213189 RepID=A0A1R1PER5_ZANCU|nr:hypothetical protein AX774_g7209 [Zancudomyces culisetae]|eukprot:OMH79372.1 hypothetical protein AX774_g7209 [Zancudomyces culisetae]
MANESALLKEAESLCDPVYSNTLLKLNCTLPKRKPMDKIKRKAEKKKKGWVDLVEIFMVQHPLICMAYLGHTYLIIQQFVCILLCYYRTSYTAFSSYSYTGATGLNHGYKSRVYRLVNTRTSGQSPLER